MAIFNSYVSLPEGNTCAHVQFHVVFPWFLLDSVQELVDGVRMGAEE